MDEVIPNVLLSRKNMPRTTQMMIIAALRPVVAVFTFFIRLLGWMAPPTSAATQVRGALFPESVNALALSFSLLSSLFSHLSSLFSLLSFSHSLFPLLSFSNVLLPPPLSLTIRSSSECTGSGSVTRIHLLFYHSFDCICPSTQYLWQRWGGRPTPLIAICLSFYL